jgi:hypothetical protein
MFLILCFHFSVLFPLLSFIVLVLIYYFFLLCLNVLLSSLQRFGVFTGTHTHGLNLKVNKMHTRLPERTNCFCYSYRLKRYFFLLPFMYSFYFPSLLSFSGITSLVPVSWLLQNRSFDITLHRALLVSQKSRILRRFPEFRFQVRRSATLTTIFIVSPQLLQAINEIKQARAASFPIIPISM